VPASYVIAGVVLGVALVGGALALRTGSTDPAPASDVGAAPGIALAAYETRLERLDQALEREREQRAALAAEVAELRRRLDERTRVAAAPSGRRAGDDRDDRVAAAHGAAEGEQRRPRGIEVDALVAAGFPEDQVRAFKQKIDQVELDRLYLRDLATREGWVGTPRFHEEDVDVGEVVRQARDEMGDEFYDWVLYSTGQPNRVRVGDVIDGSAAAAAGLQPGDLIVGYGEQRVFAPGELRDATSGGTAGDAIPISFIRDGRERQVVVPRGPLGVRIEPASEEPRPVG